MSGGDLHDGDLHLSFLSRSHSHYTYKVCTALLQLALVSETVPWRLSEEGVCVQGGDGLVIPSRRTRRKPVALCLCEPSVAAGGLASAASRGVARLLNSVDYFLAAAAVAIQGPPAAAGRASLRRLLRSF